MFVSFISFSLSFLTNLGRYSKNISKFLLVIAVFVTTLSALDGSYILVKPFRDKMFIMGSIYITILAIKSWIMDRYSPAKYLTLSLACLSLSIIVTFLLPFIKESFNFNPQLPLKIGFSLDFLLMSMALADKMRLLTKEKETHLQNQIAESNMYRMRQEKELLVKEAQAYQNLTKVMNRVFHDVQKPFSMLLATVNLFKNAENIDQVKSRSIRTHDALKSVLVDVKEMMNDLRDINREHTVNKRNESIIDVIVHCLKEKFSISHFVCNFQYHLNHKHKVNIDRGKIERVVKNILENSICAIVENQLPIADIVFTTHESNKKIQVTIKNTGTYVSKDLLPRIFEPYVSTSDVDGKGIGTIIIKKFVELHGCTASVNTSESEKWFSISFSLPLSSEVDDYKEQLPENSEEISLDG